MLAVCIPTCTCGNSFPFKRHASMCSQFPFCGSQEKSRLDSNHSRIYFQTLESSHQKNNKTCVASTQVQSVHSGRLYNKIDVLSTIEGHNKLTEICRQVEGL